MSAIVEKFQTRVNKVGSLLSVGLDTNLARAKERFPDSATPIYDYNRWIIDQTHEFAAAFKPNFAFYEGEGLEGMAQLMQTIKYLSETFPDVVTIADAKRGDIGSTNGGYVRAVFDKMGFDAITLHPWLGREALGVFLDRVDKACIVLCRTSNPGAGEFQDRLVDGVPMWQVVAESVSRDWNDNNNCMMVVGATYPKELARVREIAPEMTLLVPGIGAQGGSIEEVMAAGRGNMVINSSREILGDPNPGWKARLTRDEINRHRR